ncbi:phenol degradation protein meta, partial [Pseudomonas syringae]
MTLKISLPACLVLRFMPFVAHAADGPPPPSVSQPSGINLGGTSFYDGCAGPPGLTHQTYLKFSTASSIRTNGGTDNSAFDDPKINVVTMITQLSSYSPESIGGAHLGWSLLVPGVSLDGDFGCNGAPLTDTRAGLGDVTVGPQAQCDAIAN